MLAIVNDAIRFEGSLSELVSTQVEGSADEDYGRHIGGDPEDRPQL
jgi:hypothetical protein